MPWMEHTTTTSDVIERIPRFESALAAMQGRFFFVGDLCYTGLLGSSMEIVFRAMGQAILWQCYLANAANAPAHYACFVRGHCPVSKHLSIH